MMNIGEQIIQFYKELKPPSGLPPGVEILFPQKDPYVMNLVETFFKKYYNDDQPRYLVFGINPGRFGAGTTGINFTAPKQLKENCDIDHTFRNQTELSAEFIHEMIRKYGGHELFFRKYFITSISPLGFTKDGKNINYYDDKQLQSVLTPFIVESIKAQLPFANRGHAICIGGEKNFRYFHSLNREHNFFDSISPLPHPRFIMQYRRKQKEKYIREYLDLLRGK